MGFLTRFQVSAPPNGIYENDQYTNEDIIPMPPHRRTWKGRAYIVYWLTGGFAIYNYVTGSSLIGYGLSGGQAISACCFGPILLAFLCIFCGWPGGSHHISFTVCSRSSWGMRGTYFAVFLRVLPALIWDGIESLYGAQAVATIIGSWSLWWANWDHPLANGTLQAKDLVGLIIYYILFLITMYWPPEKLNTIFLVSCFGFIMVAFGLLIWSVHVAGGAGPYFASDYTAPKLDGSYGWAWMFGATAVLGNCGIVVLGQSDWTRFTNKGNTTPMYASLWACPLFLFLATTFGIIITSASSQILGEAYWQPVLLIRAIQAHYNNSARSRAAAFFASSAILLSQICVNIILNSVSSAMDLMAYSPKWLNIRRGAYIVAVVGICSNPWELNATAGVFLTVLAGFGIFYGPMAGIFVADFWIVRHRKLKVRDLYIGNPSSIYWYTWGINLRAVAAFICGFVPAFPGYIMQCSNLEHPVNGAIKVTRLGFILGFFISLVAYPLICWAFPPPGLGEGETTLDDNTFVLPQAFDQSKPTYPNEKYLGGAVETGSQDMSEKTGDVLTTVASAV